MVIRKVFCVSVVFLMAAFGWPTTGLGHKTNEGGRLAKIGPAWDFTLTDQEDKRVSLRDLRGTAVALTFIYTTCADTCPLLTAKMATIQRRLGRDFGTRVRFVSITVDPEIDTSEVLRQYARRHGADVTGWSFLTGTPEEIREVAATLAAACHSNSDADRLGRVAWIGGDSLFSRALPSGAPRLLAVAGAMREPRWSPSGAWLALRTGSTLHLVRWNGSGGQKLSAEVGAFAWAPRDDRIAYVAGGNLIVARAGGLGVVLLEKTAGAAAWCLFTW